MEYYSGFKKEEILSSATTWMDLEDVMLIERCKPETEIKMAYWYEISVYQIYFRAHIPYN